LDWEEGKTKEAEETPPEECYRYINNRKHSLDYKSALEKNLPIGSGEVESGHRHVIQKRLKIAGAWWRPMNAEYMLSLRVLRANNDGEDYWKHRREAA
jgi:hypothetical protein